jgi:hypothetical protein
LVGEGWFLKGLRGKIARCYDDNIKTCDFVRFEVVYESAASFWCCDVDARDICDVLCYAAKLYFSTWNYFMVEKKAALRDAAVYLLSAGVSEDLAVART